MPNSPSRDLPIWSREYLGLIRETLIASLDIPRSEGLLLRLGWQTGTIHAKTCHEKFVDDVESAVRSVLPELAAQYGYGTLSFRKVRWDARSQSFSAECTLTDSAEAHHHSGRYGTYMAPTCSFLAGWLSAILSEWTNGTVIFREME
ncbi:MAG: XylR N-terminal domain-containing protein, partial [Alicyclobacillus shizuokensis]|nr:XylR N-terminal domain-containing protein [Alicyclobacillus shizuokensis]